MRNRWMIVGIAVLVVGLATWHSGWAVCDDQAQNIAARRVVLEDHECVLVKPDTGKISWGCVNSQGGCSGVCYEGVYAEPVRICQRRTGSTCVGTKAKVKVIRMNEGVCLSNCSCKAQRAVPHEPDEIEVYRCNI